MNNLEHLTTLIDGKAPVEDAISAEKELREKYPAFILPTTLLLRHWQRQLTPDVARKALERVAVFCSDPLSLSRLQNSQNDYSNFYPEEKQKQTPTTEETISTFLKTYCNNGTDQEEETSLLEKLIFNPVPQDYAETLRTGNDSTDIPEDETISRIDSFISAHPAAKESVPEPAILHEQEKQAQTLPENLPQASPSSLLSESLAKIYIKQHRYDKAYEIISQLSLNYPEKSVYFADQLRFLRKLMLIESHRKHNSQKK